MESNLMSLKLILPRAFSYDVTTATLLPQNNKTAAVVVSKASPVGIELFFMYTTSFVPVNLYICSLHE